MSDDGDDEGEDNVEYDNREKRHNSHADNNITPQVDPIALAIWECNQSSLKKWWTQLDCMLSSIITPRKDN